MRHVSQCRMHPAVDAHRGPWKAQSGQAGWTQGSAVSGGTLPAPTPNPAGLPTTRLSCSQDTGLFSEPFSEQPREKQSQPGWRVPGREPPCPGSLSHLEED